MLRGLSVNNFFVILTLLFAIAALAFVGTMAMLAFTKAFSIIFLGSPRSEKAQHVIDKKEDAPLSMTIPMGFLSLLMLLIGLFPQYVFKYLHTPVNVLLSYNAVTISTATAEILQQISTFAILFLAFILILVLIKLKFGAKVQMHETWGCGYDRLNNHIQYTASSYASPFLSMLRPLFKNVFDIEKPKKLFPQSAHFNLQIDDIEEAYVINPIVKFDEWFLSKFEKMQSGNIQTYIKYGLIFLVIIIVGCLLIK